LLFCCLVSFSFSLSYVFRWQSDGLIYAQGQSFQVGVGFGEGDVVGVALDLDLQQIFFSKNGHVFAAAPWEGVIDAPHAMQLAPANSGSSTLAERAGLDQAGDPTEFAGDVLGKTKFVQPPKQRPTRGAMAAEQDGSHDDEGGTEEETDQNHQSGSRPSSAPGGRMKLPRLALSASSGGGTRSKKKAAKQKEALSRAIAASAAAGTQVSLLDSPSSTPRQGKGSDINATGGTASRPSTAGPFSDSLALLRTPLHGAIPPDEQPTVERVEKGNAELQRRLALTVSAAPIELPPPQPIITTPVLVPGSGGPLTPLAAPPVPAALGGVGEVGRLSRRSVSTPPAALFSSGGIGSPSALAQGNLTPSNANSAAAARLAANLARSPSPGGLTPLSAGRRRNVGVYGGAVSPTAGGNAGAAALLAAQQATLETNLAAVASIQTAAAEALANAQEVYQHNVAKASLLDAAIAAQAVPAAKAFDAITQAQAELQQRAAARQSQGRPYDDLEHAAGLARFHSQPARRKNRRMKRREGSNSAAAIIDLTDDDEADAASDDDGEAGAMRDENNDEDAVDRSTFVGGWSTHGSNRTLHARALLTNEVAAVPTTLSTRSFHDAPVPFRLRFGVPLLLPAPRPHLPPLLSTQQLASVLAMGVSVLASSDNLSRALDAVLAHTSHMLLQNQVLVRNALQEAAKGGIGSDSWFHRLQGQGDSEAAKAAAAAAAARASASSSDVDAMSFSVSSTSLMHSQPLQLPSTGSMRGVDVEGRPVDPTASRAGHQTHTHTRSASQNQAAAAGGGELAALARVATAARSRDVLEAAAPYALLPDVAASLNAARTAANQRTSSNTMQTAQDRVRMAADTLVQGRSHYVLRPCISLYSSKPLPSAARLHAQLTSHAAATAAVIGGSGGNAGDSAGGGRQSRDPSLSGPRANLHVNFDGNFKYPMHGFRPIKNAKL
jgi:hypothetical protein